MLVAGSSLTSKVKELQQDAFPTSPIYAKRQSIREPNQSIHEPNQSIHEPNQSIHEPNQSIHEPNQSIRDLQRFERNRITYLA
jgi:hypothetical protein